MVYYRRRPYRRRQRRRSAASKPASLAERLFGIVLSLVVACIIVLPAGVLIPALVAVGAVTAGVVVWAIRHRQQLGARLQAHTTRWRRDALEAAQSIPRLLQLTPTEFEQVVGEVLAGAGWTGVQHTGQAGDQGVDLVGYDPSGQFAVVQCKRYAPSRSIGTPDLQRFLGSQRIYNASAAVFVATCRFSGPAQTLATQHNIQLVDGAGLANLARRAIAMLPPAPRPAASLKRQRSRRERQRPASAPSAAPRPVAAPAVSQPEGGPFPPTSAALPADPPPAEIAPPAPTLHVQPPPPSSYRIIDKRAPRT